MHHLFNFYNEKLFVITKYTKVLDIYIHLIVVDFVNYYFKYLINSVRIHKISVYILYLTIN